MRKTLDINLQWDRDTIEDNLGHPLTNDQWETILNQGEEAIVTGFWDWVENLI